MVLKQITKAIISAMKEREGPIALHTFPNGFLCVQVDREVNPSDCQKPYKGGEGG